MYIQVHILSTLHINLFIQPYPLHINLLIQPYQHINETIKYWYKSAGDKLFTNISLFTVQNLEIQTVYDHILQFTKILYLYKSIVEKIY